MAPADRSDASGARPLERAPSERVSERDLVLARAGQIVLAYKPAGWATEPTAESSECLVSTLARLLGVRRIHAASRLDVGVSGVVLCTTGSLGAREVEQLRLRGAIRHEYLAIVAGRPAERGQWADALGRGRDGAGRARAIVNGSGARAALTLFERLGCVDPDDEQASPAGSSVLRLRLVTGRMHQIRAHARAAGHPIYGDRRYRGPIRLVDPRGAVHPVTLPALHCHWVELEGSIGATAPIPARFRELWARLGGDDAVWGFVAVTPRPPPDRPLGAG